MPEAEFSEIHRDPFPYKYNWGMKKRAIFGTFLSVDKQIILLTFIFKMIKWAMLPSLSAWGNLNVQHFRQQHMSSCQHVKYNPLRKPNKFRLAARDDRWREWVIISYSKFNCMMGFISDEENQNQKEIWDKSILYLLSILDCIFTAWKMHIYRQIER